MDLRLLHATSLKEAASTLMASSVELTLLDLVLPESRGLDTVRAFTNMAPKVPFVVLTGMDDDELGRSCIDLGAQDYLPKDRVLQDAPRIVDYALRRLDAQRLRGRLPPLAQSALGDPLPEGLLRRAEQLVFEIVGGQNSRATMEKARLFAEHVIAGEHDPRSFLWALSRSWRAEARDLPFGELALAMGLLVAEIGEAYRARAKGQAREDA